jgi:hypothetical protein
MRLRSLAALGIGLAFTFSALAPAAAHAPSKPHIVSMQYYTDAEARPYNNIVVFIKGDANFVRATVDGVKDDGRSIGTFQEQNVWFFHGREFVRTLQADLHADGVVEATVRAVGDTGGIKKLCTLVLDPSAGEFELAEGDCKKL